MKKKLNKRKKRAHLQMFRSMTFVFLLSPVLRVDHVTIVVNLEHGLDPEAAGGD